MSNLSEIAYCKIFPSIGIARVGDSPLREENIGWFMGPEMDDAAPHHTDTSFVYRDPAGRIMRQGARFRVYAYDAKDNLIGEITDDEAMIEWHCQLANKKASWFNFSGTKEALDALDGKRSPDLINIRNASVGKMNRQPDDNGSFGNYYVNSEERKSLEIVTPLTSISGKNQITEDRNDEKQFEMTGFFKKVRPVKLGELQTDSKGRLIILGGHGISDAVSADGKSIRDKRWILNYANNDDWHDDVSDGFVKATVSLRSNNEQVKVEGAAWIIVAPPNYAPDVQNLVTLYDVMEEVTRDTPTIAAKGTAVDCRNAEVYYDEHIRPILKSMLDMRWVNAQALRGHGSAKPGDAILDGSISDPCSDEGAEQRQHIFSLIRKPYYIRPAVSESDNVLKRGHQLAVKMANSYYMPPLSGDEGTVTDGDPTKWLSLTYLQYERLEAWCEGNFRKARDNKKDKKLTIESEPHSLTRMALEKCCGGAFYPGIEMTCSSRHPKMYREAFRLDDSVLQPGDVTKFMACPWQADFYECRDNWWPAQRPDDVLVDEDLDEIFDSFEEERSSPSEFERTLFKRKKWARGLGLTRPSGEFLDSQILPEAADAEAMGTYIEREFGLSYTIYRYFLRGLLYAGVRAPEGSKWKERINSPWRVQFLIQDAVDRYSGRYFKIALRSPESVFSTLNTAKNSELRKLKEELLKSLDEKELPDIAAIRDSWSNYRATNPERAQMLVNFFYRQLRHDIEADITGTLIAAASTLDKKDQTANELRKFLAGSSVGSVEAETPNDFAFESDAYKRARVLDMITAARDIAYIHHRAQAGDMEMVDDWKRLGIVLTRKLDRTDEGEKTAKITVQAETGRGTYDGVSVRDAFYYMMNIEKYPDFRPTAKKLAEKFLQEGRDFIEREGLQDPEHPESFIPYNKVNFEAKLEQIYEIYRERRDNAEPWATGRRTRDELSKAIFGNAPFNQTDGSWLRNIAKTGTTDEVRSLLFQVWSDEIGEGDTSMNHANIYTNLLRHLGHWTADVATRAYANDSRIDDTAFLGAIVPLAISEHTEAFYPEIIGMTLFLEWEVLSLAPFVKTFDYVGIPSLFFSLHVGIDNAMNGHGYQAKRAVEIYLDNVNAESGPEMMQEHWKRIWTGFATFALAGGARFQNDVLQQDTNINADRLESPEMRVIELIREKKAYGNLNHFEKRLGGHRINDLFDDPALFVQELAHSPWVVAGDPDNSRLLSELSSYKGPMFKVFAKEDLKIWRDWILWLGEEGGTSSPKNFVTKAEAMLVLLTELREKAMATEAHERYSVTVPDKNSKYKKNPPHHCITMRELFDQEDLTEVMRALKNPANAWVVVGKPEDSPLVREFLAPSRPMGQALDRRFLMADNRIGRIIIIDWIEAGCPIPGEEAPGLEQCRKPKKRDETKMFVDVYWGGSVH